MLRLTAEVRPGVSVQVEAETQKELFQQYAGAWEVFSEPKCGLCGSGIRPKYREVTVGKQVYDYHEYECLDPDCRARLGLGAHMAGGTLFPQRKLMPNGEPEVKKHREAGLSGTYGRHNGWTKYRGESSDQSDHDDSQPQHQGTAPVSVNRSHVNAAPPAAGPLNDKPGSVTRAQRDEIDSLAMQFGWSYAQLCQELQAKVNAHDPTKLSERVAAAVIGGLRSKAKREAA